MKTREARDLGNRIALLVRVGQPEDAYSLLAPLLAERTPFRLLDRIGEALKAGPSPETDTFLGRVAADKTEGGWVVVASALRQQLGRDSGGVFARCRDFIILADIWYATVIFGLRVPGPAMVADFEPTLELLAPWREHDNRWVRRTVGCAANLWARHSQGALEYLPQAEALLLFLEPMFGEWDMDAVKGVSWGLKALGRYYPELVADWLTDQVVHRNRLHRALMLRKASKYLPEEHRARITGAMS